MSIIYNLPKSIILYIFKYFGRKSSRNYTRNVTNFAATCKLFYSKFKLEQQYIFLYNRKNIALPNIKFVYISGCYVLIGKTDKIKKLYICDSYANIKFEEIKTIKKIHNEMDEFSDNSRFDKIKIKFHMYRHMVNPNITNVFLTDTNIVLIKLYPNIKKLYITERIIHFNIGRDLPDTMRQIRQHLDINKILDIFYLRLHVFTDITPIINIDNIDMSFCKIFIIKLRYHSNSYGNNITLKRNIFIKDSKIYYDFSYKSYNGFKF